MQTTAKNFTFWSLLNQPLEFRPFSSWNYYGGKFEVDLNQMAGFMRDMGLIDDSCNFSTDQSLVSYYSSGYITAVQNNVSSERLPQLHDIKKFMKALQVLCDWILKQDISAASTVENTTESEFTGTECESETHEALSGEILFNNLPGIKISFNSTCELSLEETDQVWSIHDSMSEFKKKYSS